MANTKISSPKHEFAVVDTRPTSDGFFTNEIDIREKLKVARVFFSIREFVDDISEAPSDNTASVITVVLQFKRSGDADWTEYKPLDGSTFAIGNVVELTDAGNGVMYRAGVTSRGYTSGSVKFGFDW